jgi:8-oxo-dGTP diphosphatase
MSKRLYVAGFCFDAVYNKVALIQKTKPAWQNGKLNGIGGKIEPEEHPVDAMVREFFEETGVIVPAELWTQFCVVSNDDWVVYFFKAKTNRVYDVTTTTEEEVKLIRVETVFHWEVIPNLHWLIPMALQHDVLTASVQYKNDGT